MVSPVPHTSSLEELLIRKQEPRLDSYAFITISEVVLIYEADPCSSATCCGPLSPFALRDKAFISDYSRGRFLRDPARSAGFPFALGVPTRSSRCPRPLRPSHPHLGGCLPKSPLFSRCLAWHHTISLTPIVLHDSEPIRLAPLGAWDTADLRL